MKIILCGYNYLYYFFYSMFVFLGGSLLRRILSDIYKMRAVRTTAKHKLRIGLCVGGQTINQLLRRLRGHEWHVKGKWTIVLVGTNDCLQRKTRGDGKIWQAYRRLLHKIKRCGPKGIVLCTLPPLFQQDRLINDLIPIYNHVIRRVAREEKVVLADLHTKLDGRWDCMLKDGIHHNTNGMYMIVHAVQEA